MTNHGGDSIAAVADILVEGNYPSQTNGLLYGSAQN
jgi:hypothetical protein